MHVKAQRWGNSLAVRIPKAVAEEIGVHEQDELEIEVAGGIIQLRPRSPNPSLEELLGGVTRENLHGEVDLGRPEGAEAW
jgi:antitoxin MazE